jgi:hypothetical protein
MKLNKIIILYLLLTSANMFPQVLDSTETDPVNITAMAVIQKYIYAIGGMDNFKSVVDRTTIMSGLAMNQAIKITIKQKYPDKLYQELAAGEMKQLIYYNDGKGKLKIGDEITDIEGKELERLKLDATMQFLLDPESYGVKTDLLPDEFVDSVDCYAIKFTLPSGIRWFQYYDIATSLKFKETKEIQTKQGLFEQDTYFSDYREVKGVKYPFKIVQYLGLQEIELNVISIDVNTGLDDKIFELPE